MVVIAVAEDEGEVLEGMTQAHLILRQTQLETIFNTYLIL
jgi:hypothetical protein